MPMIEPLQTLTRLEENSLYRPHGKPDKHHRDNLAREVQVRGPERQVPSTCQQLRQHEEDDGEEDVVVVSCCIRRMVPASSPIPTVPSSCG